MLLLIYLAFIAVLFNWQVKMVKARKTAKGKAIGLYAAYSIAPIILYGVVFLALVAIEELTDAAIIGEGYARSLPFVIVGGLTVTLLATLIFTLVVMFLKLRNFNAT